MKKIILTTLLSFGLTLAVSADNKVTKKYKSDKYRGHSTCDTSHPKHYNHTDRSYRTKRYSNHRRAPITYTTKRTWVSACSKRVWVGPQYEYVRQRCGTVVRVCVSEGYYKVVREPGYYTYKRVPVYHRSERCNERGGLSVYWRF